MACSQEPGKEVVCCKYIYTCVHLPWNCFAEVERELLSINLIIYFPTGSCQETKPCLEALGEGHYQSPMVCSQGMWWRLGSFCSRYQFIPEKYPKGFIEAIGNNVFCRGSFCFKDVLSLRVYLCTYTLTKLALDIFVQLAQNYRSWK